MRTCWVGISLLTCLFSTHPLSFSHFHSPSLHSHSQPHTHILVTIKQVVLSSCQSPYLLLCAIYALSQLLLTVEPQLTSHTHMLMCTLTHSHRHLHIVCTLWLAPSHCRCPFTISSQTATQSVQQEGHSFCLSACKCH